MAKCKICNGCLRKHGTTIVPIEPENYFAEIFACDFCKVYWIYVPKLLKWLGPQSFETA